MVMKIKDVFTTKYGEWQVYYSVAGGAWTTLHGSKGCLLYTSDAADE